MLEKFQHNWIGLARVSMLFIIWGQKLGFHVVLDFLAGQLHFFTYLRCMSQGVSLEILLDFSEQENW